MSKVSACTRLKDSHSRISYTVAHLQASLTREKGATHIETIVSTPMTLPASEMSVPIESCSLSEGRSAVKKDAPLIIYLHGGPNGTSSTGWSSARFAL